jgi:quercetin dioxygenase-like cupin family protein
MRKMLILLGATCISGLVVSGATGIATAQAQQIKRTELQRTDIKEMEGREGVMYLAELPPGAASGWHFHPGPEYIYVVEGTMILEPQGHQPVTLKKGESAHQEAKHVHNARNSSQSEPARALVFLISEKGAPLATPVEPPAGAAK